jgi:hypothetical protein
MILKVLKWLDATNVGSFKTQKTSAKNVTTIILSVHVISA